MQIYSLKNNLNGGEISPQMISRFDISRYQSACTSMKNFVPIPQGGITRRSGFKFLDYAKDQEIYNTVRLFSFVYSTTQSRVLEFGNYYMRVWLPSGELVTNDDGTIYELTTPYSVWHVMELSIIQSSDILFIAHASYPPAKISRYADNNFVHEVLTFMPTIASPVISKTEIMGETILEDEVDYSYQVTAISSSGQESEVSDIADVTAMTLSQSYYIRITFTAVDDVVEYRIYKKRNGVYGFIGRTTDLYFDDKAIIADTADTPPAYKNPFEENYPMLVFLHQQRLGFASSDSQPLTVWLSQSGNLYSFASSLPPNDDDAIEATLASSQASRIIGIAQDVDSIILFTESSEWLFSALSGSVLTPTNLSFQLQSSWGSENFIFPVNIGGTIAFVQRGSQTIRSTAYDYEYGKYMAHDLALLSRHFFLENNIITWAWQNEPYSILWCVTTTGGLFGLSYIQDQDIIAWHKHETDGFIESLCVIPSSKSDVVFISVLRKKADGTYSRIIEKLEDFFNSSNKEDAFFLDSALTFESDSQDISEIIGLEHLEGREVSIFSDGFVQVSKIVENGKIILDTPAKKVHVGLAYSSEFIPTVPQIVTQEGSTLFFVRKTKAISFLIYQSMSFCVQTTEENKGEIAHHEILNLENRAINIDPSFFDMAEVTINIADGYYNAVSPTISIDKPTPVTVLSMVSTIELANQPSIQTI